MTDTLLRLGDDLVVVKTDDQVDGAPRLYVACTASKQIGATLNMAQVMLLSGTLSGWLEAVRLTTPGKEYDHDPGPDSSPGDGYRCKVCGEDITWVGPSNYDWLHVDDKENR